MKTYKDLIQDFELLRGSEFYLSSGMVYEEIRDAIITQPNKNKLCVITLKTKNISIKLPWAYCLTQEEIRSFLHEHLSEVGNKKRF
ncbi:MAG: hypothetical protein WC648_04160 [Candidatus Paceibacterota bacterium]|jgi:hypothetical protein